MFVLYWLTHVVLSCEAKLPSQYFIVKDSTIFASENSWSSCFAILDNSYCFGFSCLTGLRHKISRAIGDILSTTIKPLNTMTQEQRNEMLNKAYKMSHELNKMHKFIYDSKEFSRTAKNIITLACDALSTLIDMLL